MAGNSHLRRIPHCGSGFEYPPPRRSVDEPPGSNPVILISMRILAVFLFACPGFAGEFAPALKPFLETHCYDCHGDGSSQPPFAPGQRRLQSPPAKSNFPAVELRSPRFPHIKTLEIAMKIAPEGSGTTPTSPSLTSHKAGLSLDFLTG